MNLIVSFLKVEDREYFRSVKLEENLIGVHLIKRVWPEYLVQLSIVDDILFSPKERAVRNAEVVT